MPSACSWRLSEKYTQVNKVLGWYSMTLVTVALNAMAYLWHFAAALDTPETNFTNCNGIAFKKYMGWVFGCLSQFSNYLKWDVLNVSSLT